MGGVGEGGRGADNPRLHRRVADKVRLLRALSATKITEPSVVGTFVGATSGQRTSVLVEEPLELAYPSIPADGKGCWLVKSEYMGNFCRCQVSIRELGLRGVNVLT